MGKDENGRYAIVTSYQMMNGDDCLDSLCDGCLPNSFQNGSSKITLWTNPDNPNPVCMYIEPSGNFGPVYYFEIIYYQDNNRNPIEIPPEKVDYWIKQSSTW